ncbi:DUF6892 domain-containing protein [Nocardia sp. NPDC057663]|uniref:DUF6892 domain-containing protein n=1 Tax=Nocardia sp. NPDC057663 TaxID=3346201 RepID=UPI00367201EF
MPGRGSGAQVTNLCLDGDREVYQLHPGWWHFGRHFSITNLDGIAYCEALEDLDLNSMVEATSLAPLAGLTRLQHLRLDAGIQRRGRTVTIKGLR